jgi:hypothetical protein
VQSGFPGSEYPLNHPRIGWRSIAGAAVSGDALDGFPASNALDVRTALAWKPDAATGWVGVDAGDDVEVSYCGIAGHDLGRQNATISVQKWDGTGWVGIVSDIQPSDDNAIMVLFAPIESAFHVQNGLV